MSKVLTAVLTLAFVFSIAGFAAAADKKKPDGAKKPSAEEIFKKKDADSDGKLSVAEFKGKLEGDKAAKAEERFKKIDKNSDGSLSLEEFTAAFTPKKKKDAK